VEDKQTLLTITNILTLRYDPTQKPLLPKLGWKDFIPSKTEPSLEFIEQSIKNQIPKNVKNASIALSGGVDSTLSLTMLRNVLPEAEINAISVRFAESVDEIDAAEKIARHFNTEHHIIEIDNYLKELPKAISILKLPFWDIHWYYVAKKAQTISTILVSGDGGDELFGGYTFRYKKFLEITNENSTPLEKIQAYLQCHERDWVPDQDKIFGNKALFSWEQVYSYLYPYFDNSLSRLDQVILADYSGKLLYNFSLVNSSLHDNFKLKSISPLLSNELISYMPSISNQYKYDKTNNVGKLLLRKLLAKYKIDSFTSTEKLGFNVNTINLWKSHGRRLCKNYLIDGQIIKAGLINNDWLSQYIDKNLDIRYVNKFLGLLALEIWYRLFVTKEIKDNLLLN
jgi:asparagine synthase (glutamine-hydrolysing)